jgi:hypothetical protein
LETHCLRIDRRKGHKTCGVSDSSTTKCPSWMNFEAASISLRRPRRSCEITHPAVTRELMLSDLSPLTQKHSWLYRVIDYSR